MTFRGTFSLSWLIACVLILGCNRATESLEPPGWSAPLTPAEELSETIVWPHLEGPLTPDNNYVYCSTMQLAWNELRDKVIGAPIQMENGPAWLDSLNEGRFSRDDLSEDCYLAMGGPVEDNIHEQIGRAMRERFPRASLELPELPQGATFFVYAYLAKSLPFEHAFERFDNSISFPQHGTATPVEAFGIDWSEHQAADLQSRNVRVLDYVSADDFILALLPRDTNDRIVLAKVQPGSVRQDAHIRF